MKKRRDAVAVSSFIFTLALLMPAPAIVRDGLTFGQTRFQVTGREWYMQNCFAPSGFSSFAVILIGLTVTWAGYRKGVRWAWFVMFAIVWLWAFPVLLLPYLQPWRGPVPFTQSFPSALSESGTVRDFVEVVLIFLLMVLALALPAKTFILGRGVERTGRSSQS